MKIAEDKESGQGFAYKREDICMKYYDITRELFSTEVYPGDPIPEREEIRSIQKGDSTNLSSVKMCVHNATHMDAPKHFIEGGRDIGAIPPEQFIGDCVVLEYDGILEPEDAKTFLEWIAPVKKLLWKGDVYFGAETSQVFVDYNVELIGVERQTVGLEGKEPEAHKVLLGADMVILEGLDLTAVKAGSYFLYAAPMKMAGSEGAPCRAILME